jgi:hypothetical protein
MGTTRFSASSSPERFDTTFTWVELSTISMDSSPRMSMSSSIWSLLSASAGRASLISS